MSDINLFDKFPDLRPLRALPSLGTTAGCGLALRGSRDYDEETGTVVKTRCFCLLGIPVLAVDAYRVVNTPSGWYFLGRVPLSGQARLWNGLLVCSLLALIGLVAWDRYTHSLDYLAGQKVAEADRLAEAGQVAQAAQLYREVAAGYTSHARTALAKFKDMLDGPVAAAPPADAAQALKTAVELHQKAGTLPDLFERGMKLADKHAPADPRGALALVEAVAPLAKDADALAERRLRLLEQLVVKEPDDPEAASQLAVLYEAKKQLDKCEKLLAPHAGRLGTREGARILGQILARQGKEEQAHALLLPYTEERLKRLHAAEDAYQNAYGAIVNQIRNGTAPDFPYQRVNNAAGKAEQQAIFQEYMKAKQAEDPTLKAAWEAFRREAQVVPAALDLGMVILRRAQGVADAAARRKELEKAEKTFLAIRGAAGESDSYRLYLGQVYYWLGKHAEGRKLFDELLTAHNKSANVVSAVAQVLRAVGANTEARALLEEAYAKEADAAKKQGLASVRSLLYVDLDDEITWLRRADLEVPQIKADLGIALGNKALQEGNDEEAARHLREAIAIYAGLPVSASTLNNGGLAHFKLYQATGERAALDKGFEMVEQSVALSPSDSILLHNAAAALLGAALRDVIGPALDLKALKRQGSLDLLAFLYEDRAGRDRYAERVRQHPGIARARTYLDRLLVLAPKSPHAYGTLAALHGVTRDLEALRALRRRLDEAALDLADSTREMLDHYGGKKDEKTRKELAAGLARQEVVVKATRPGRGATFAAAATTLARLLLSMDAVGMAADADRAVTLAEEAHAAAPSSATRSALTDALLARASRALAKQEPEYAALASRAKRALGPNFLVAVALSREGKPRAAALANADVRRAVGLVKEGQAKFPEDPDGWSWAMLRAGEPDEAAKVARALAQDELGKVARAINQKLSPVSAAEAFRAYWALESAGKEAEGREVLKRFAARGAPMPFPLEPPAQ
jgi:hypothetical protein